MAISLRVCDLDTSGTEPVYRTETDEELIEVGGRWDRRKKRWAGEAQRLRILRVPRGSDQEQPARWLAEWFDRYAAGPRGKHWDAPKAIAGEAVVEFRRVWTLLLVGGRRGGKSHLGVVALVMMAVLTPRSWLWAVSPTQEETDELEAAVRELAPAEWFTVKIGKTNKTTTFRFVDGSRLLLLSGHKPRALKRGRVDLALYNEAQNMYRAGWRQLRGAVADRSGLVLIACNPPDAEIGRWIEEVHEQARAGKIAALAFHFRGSNNPFVSAEALEDMRREVDDVTARKEIDGEMGVPIGDVVFHAWSDAETVRDVPTNLVDVTAEFTRKHLGKAFGYVVGMDFQQTPHMAAAVYRFFRDPNDPSSEVLAWIVDEVIVENADEDDLLDALEALPRWEAGGRDETQCYRGWAEAGDDAARPVHCGVVMDASGFFQDGAHTKGRTSDKVLRARKWAFLYRPQPPNPDGTEVKRNPQVAERVKVTNTRLKIAGEGGRRRMFSCPHNLRINRAMREWQNHKVTGAPSKHSNLAHACDAVSYVIYRFFGVPKVKGGGAAPYWGAGRFKRGDLFTGALGGYGGKKPW